MVKPFRISIYSYLPPPIGLEAGMPMLNILLTQVISAEYVFQNFVVLTHCPHPYAGSHYGNCEECHHEKLPEESIAYHEAVCIEKREVRNKEVIEHINGEGTLSHMCNESHYATIDGKEGRCGSLITEIAHYASQLYGCPNASFSPPTPNQ